MFGTIFTLLIIVSVLILIFYNHFGDIANQIKKNIKKFDKESLEIYNLDYDPKIESINASIKLHKKDINKEINALLQDKEALINSDFERALVDEDYYREKEYNPIWLIFKENKSNWLDFLPTIKNIYMNYKIKKSYISILKPGYTISSYIGDKSTLRYTICLSKSEDFFILNNKVLDFENGMIWDHGMIHHYSNNGSKNGVYLHIEVDKQLPLSVKLLYKITKD